MSYQFDTAANKFREILQKTGLGDGTEGLNGVELKDAEMSYGLTGDVAKERLEESISRS